MLVMCHLEQNSWTPGQARGDGRGTEVSQSEGAGTSCPCRVEAPPLSGSPAFDAVVQFLAGDGAEAAADQAADGL